MVPPSHVFFSFRRYANAASVGPLYLCSTMLVTVPTTRLIFRYAFLTDAQVQDLILIVVVIHLLVGASG